VFMVKVRVSSLWLRLGLRLRLLGLGDVWLLGLG